MAFLPVWNGEMNQYFKRYKMEVSLRRTPICVAIPAGYRLLPWDEHLLEAHAIAKHHSFRDELDSTRLPLSWRGSRLPSPDGRDRNQVGIRARGNVAGSLRTSRRFARLLCTVQGIRDQFGRGGIQNLGVTPEHRGQGVGASLLHHASARFRRLSVLSVHLEVTAKNANAIRLYRNMGFRHIKTVYKSVEVAMT